MSSFCSSDCFCSFSLTSKQPIEQAIYVCVTCQENNKDNENELNKCCCSGCAETCHAGHEVSLLAYGCGYCDCGENNCDLYIKSIKKIDEVFPQYQKKKGNFLNQQNNKVSFPFTEYSFKSENNEEESLNYSKLLSLQIKTLIKLSKETFWITSNEDSSCHLEELVKIIGDYHIRNECYINNDFDENKYQELKKIAGFEWWVQVRDDKEDEISNENSNRGVQGVDLHYDKDEALAASFGLGIFPSISTVTYVNMTSSLCHPTIIVPQNLITPVGMPLMDSYLSFPSYFKHIAFDGRYLHGAPSELHSISKLNNRSDPYILSSSGERITFLVNIWIGHEPLEASRIPNEIANSLNENYLNQCYESKYIDPNEDQKEINRKNDPLFLTSFNLTPIFTVNNNENKENSFAKNLPTFPSIQISEKETQLEDDDEAEENEVFYSNNKRNYNETKNYLDPTISCGKWYTIPFVSSKSEWGKAEDETGLELSIWLPTISFPLYSQRIEQISKIKKSKRSVSLLETSSNISYSSYHFIYMTQIAAARLEYEESEEFEDEFADEFNDPVSEASAAKLLSRTQINEVSQTNTQPPSSSSLPNFSLKPPSSISDQDPLSSSINTSISNKEMISSIPLLASSSSTASLFSPPNGEVFLREKEKQILRLYDQNTEQLSAMVAERDTMLLSAAQAMNIIKKDFAHNLNLLKTREEELKLLESEKKELLEKFEYYEQEINNMSERCGDLINKEIKKSETIENEKLMNKQLIEELRSVIESIQFSSNEEIKLREEEIIALRNENKSLMEANEINLNNLIKSIESKFDQNEKNLLREYKKKESYYTNLNNNLTTKIDTLNEKIKSFMASNFEEKEKNETLLSKNSILSIKVKELEIIKEELELKNKNLTSLSHLYEDKDKKKKLEFENNLQKIECLWKEQYDKLEDTNCELKIEITKSQALVTSNQTLYQKELNKLRESLKQKEKDLISIQDIQKRHENELKLYYTKQQSVIIQNNELKQNSFSMMSQLGSKDNEINFLKADKEKLEMNNKEYQQVIENQQDILVDNKVLLSQLDILKEENENLKKTNSIIQSELKNLESSLKEAELSKEKVKQSFEKELETLTSSNKSLQEKVDSILQKKKLFNTKIKKLFDTEQDEVSEISINDSLNVQDTRRNVNETDEDSDYEEDLIKFIKRKQKNAVEKNKYVNSTPALQNSFVSAKTESDKIEELILENRNLKKLIDIRKYEQYFNPNTQTRDFNEEVNEISSIKSLAIEKEYNKELELTLEQTRNEISRLKAERKSLIESNNQMKSTLQRINSLPTQTPQSFTTPPIPPYSSSDSIGNFIPKSSNNNSRRPSQAEHSLNSEVSDFSDTWDNAIQQFHNYNETLNSQNQYNNNNPWNTQNFQAMVNNSNSSNPLTNYIDFDSVDTSIRNLIYSNRNQNLKQESHFDTEPASISFNTPQQDHLLAQGIYPIELTNTNHQNLKVEGQSIASTPSSNFNADDSLYSSKQKINMNMNVVRGTQPHLSSRNSKRMTLGQVQAFVRLKESNKRHSSTTPNKSSQSINQDNSSMISSSNPNSYNLNQNYSHNTSKETKKGINFLQLRELDEKEKSNNPTITLIN